MNIAKNLAVILKADSIDFNVSCLTVCNEKYNRKSIIVPEISILNFGIQ